ncbi:MAG: hypothetical protein EKK40_17505 [Bradyrhizobiaceae bacterium]|nr:MAG: hypothetical protein EKK40_17505 [Bradyrhizobiaceae bacterium]
MFLRNLFMVFAAYTLSTSGPALADVTLSKPFLQKTGFDLTSAGFKVRFANDPAGQRALRALPPNRFVIHTLNGVDHYLFADPKVCVCIFVGNKDNYMSYRFILQNPTGLQPNDVSPDYKSNAEVMLNDPLGTDSIYEPDTIAEVLQDYY